MRPGPADAKGVEGKGGEQHVDQDHDREQGTVGFGGGYGHEERKQEVTDKGEAELTDVDRRRHCRAKNAHLGQPAAREAEPEQTVGPKGGRPKKVVVLEVVDAGDELGHTAEENGPRDDEGEAGGPTEFNRGREQRDHGEPEKAQRGWVGDHNVNAVFVRRSRGAHKFFLSYVFLKEARRMTVRMEVGRKKAKKCGLGVRFACGRGAAAGGLLQRCFFTWPRPAHSMACGDGDFDR